MVCAVVVFLAGVSYLVYSRYVSPPPDRGYGYLYCPKCGLEQKAGADQKDKKVLCPRCGPWPQPMVYSSWSQAESGGDVGLLVPAICVGGLGAMGLLYAYISLVRPRLRRGAGVTKVYRFRCPGCQRKFQFTRSPGRPTLHVPEVPPRNRYPRAFERLIPEVAVPPRILCWVTGFVLAALTVTYGMLSWWPGAASPSVPLLEYRTRAQTPALTLEPQGPGIKVEVLHRVTERARGRRQVAAKQPEPWPQFRGPTGEGHAGGPSPPLTWSETENIKWKAAIPGKGWSSPVLQGDQIWLTTALEPPYGLRAICLDRNSGELVHDVRVFNSSDPIPVHPKNSRATPTPVIEGDRVYVHFGPFGTACLSTAGEVLWRRSRDMHRPTGLPAVRCSLGIC